MTLRSGLVSVLVAVNVHTVVAQPDCDAIAGVERYYTLNGNCNNFEKPLQGSAHTHEIRTAEGVDFGRQFDPLPTARSVSNNLFAESHEGTKSSVNLTHLVPIFGQFLVHDLVETEFLQSRVMLEVEDPDIDFFSMQLSRLMGGDRGQNQTVNVVTSYLDLSVVYGSSQEMADSLRSKTGGLLKTSNEELARRGGARYQYSGKAFPLCTTCVDVRSMYPRSFNVSDALVRPEVPSCQVENCDGTVEGIVCGSDPEWNRTSGRYRDVIYTPLRDWLPLGSQVEGSTAGSESFVAGDARASENPVLSSVHALFLRNHNLIARRLRVENPQYTDEQLFQEARRLNIYQYQHIIYSEYLPTLLGSGNTPSTSTQYNTSVDASISNLFATAGFRLHTLLPSNVEMRYRDGRLQSPANGFDRAPLVQNSVGIDLPPQDLANNELAATGQVVRGTFTPVSMLAFAGGEDALMKTATTQLCNEADERFSPSLRNIRFDMKCPTPRMPAGRYLTDIPAQSVARGRLHGLPSYDHVRRAFGPGSVYQTSACGMLDERDSLRCFRLVTGESSADSPIANTLRRLYSKVDMVDAFAGFVVEPKLPGSLFGATQTGVIADQFRRLSAGDRLFYTHQLTATEQQQLAATASMKRLIESNFDVEVQENPFRRE